MYSFVLCNATTHLKLNLSILHPAVQSANRWHLLQGLIRIVIHVPGLPPCNYQMGNAYAGD